MSPQATLPLHQRVLMTLYVLYRSVWESDVTTRASSLCYTLVFSLVPLLTTTVAFFTAFPGLENERDQLMRLVFSQLLPGGISQATTYIEMFSQRAAAAGAISSTVFLILVLLLFRSLENTFNRIWKAEEGRTWGEKLRSLAVFFTLGSVAVTLWITLQRAASGMAERLHDVDIYGVADSLTRIALALGNIVVAWGLFTGANKILPNTHVRWTPALIAGISMGTVWHFSKNAFTWYISNVASYENIYGAVGTIPAFFLWLYLSLLFLLISCYLTFISQNLSSLLWARKNVDEHRQVQGFYAVAAVTTLAQAFKNKRPLLSIQDIAARNHIPTYFVADVLPRLCAAGIVLSVPKQSFRKHCAPPDSKAAPKGTERRYLLMQPSESLTVGDVVRHVSDDALRIPETEMPTPLHQKVQQIFRTAAQQQHELLHRLTIAELVGEREE